MLRKYFVLLITVAFAAGVYPPFAQARDMPVRNKALSTEERLARVERLLENQGLVDLLLRLESLQTEVQQLRGDIEVQHHTLKNIKKRQRDLYVDIDRRLLQIERKGGVAVMTPTPVSPSPSSSPVVTAPVIPSQTESSVAKKPLASAKPDKVETGAGLLKEQQAYQKAFDLLRDLRYEKAVEAFRKFLNDYPNGRYAHIAQYWIAEASYAKRRFKEAISDYQKLINNYPSSPKLAEAMLKIGYSQYEQGDYDAARRSLEKLIKTYPGTTEAGQGQNLLQKVKLKQQKR